jgi:hypothetical protein
MTKRVTRSKSSELRARNFGMIFLNGLGSLCAIQADDAGSIPVGRSVLSAFRREPRIAVSLPAIILWRGEMARKRAPYAKRSVWYVVIPLAAVVVIGFAAAGYEINHLRTEVNGLHTQIQSINNVVSLVYSEVLKLLAQRSP